MLSKSMINTWPSFCRSTAVNQAASVVRAGKPPALRAARNPRRRRAGEQRRSVERGVSGRYTGQGRMNGHHGRRTAGPVAVFSPEGYGLGPREEPLFDR